MSRTACGLIAAALFAATSLAATSFVADTAFAQTPSWTPPPDSARCPSKWGAGDERGSGNHMKPQSVLNAAKLIKTGEVIELGHVLHAGMPVSRGRSFELQTKRTTQLFGSNRRGSNEELMVAEMGQVGTQFDGFAHQTHENTLYNCFKMEDVATRTGFTKLGVQNVGALMTRGVLIDVAGYKGVDMLGDSYEITVDDLEGALKKENLTLQPGDAVIIHTGWGKLWDKDNVRYMKSNPGIGVKAAQWLIAKDPMLMGSDNTPVEVAPPADPALSGPIHQMALVIYGVPSSSTSSSMSSRRRVSTNSPSSSSRSSSKAARARAWRRSRCADRNATGTAAAWPQALRRRPPSALRG